MPRTLSVTALERLVVTGSRASVVARSFRAGALMFVSLGLAACVSSVVPLEPRPPRRIPGLDEPPPSPAVPAALTAMERQYFTANPLMVPVAGVSPASVRNSFDEPRSGGRTHRAYDIMAARRTPVLAAIDGQVLAMRQNALGGITVYLLDRDRRFVYYYAHLDGYARGLREGDAIRQGNPIGYVGTTGNAPPNAPHLHFQVMRVDPARRDWWNGAAVDVRGFFGVTGRERRR